MAVHGLEATFRGAADGMTQLIHMDYHKMDNSTTQRRSDTLEVANSKKGATAIPSMVALRINEPGNQASTKAVSPNAAPPR